MSQVKCNISISLDGFVAGPDPGPEDPLGKGGMQLHEWILGLSSWRSSHGHEGGETGPDDEIAAEHAEGVGASVMGRGMFGGGEGPWGPDPWTGWWGDDPPFKTPVFVLTHHDREPLEMEGGTTFTFVTDGIESAVAQARAAAGDKDVAIGGGAGVIQQCLAAGLLDELHVHVVPVLLGGGTRLFGELGPQAPSSSSPASSTRRRSRTSATACCAEGPAAPWPFVRGHPSKPPHAAPKPPTGLR